jgi:hypothetical protein
VALVLPLAGCGGATPEFEGVASAATKVERAKTMRFAVTAEIDGFELVGEGAIDLARKRMRASTEHPRLGAFETIFVDDVIFVKAPRLLETGEKQWAKIEDLGVAGELPDPSEALSLLRKAGQFEPEGSEDVRGVATTRYRGRMTVESEIAPEGSVVEAWVDADGYLRRLRYHDGRDTATMDFYDFGAAVDIEAPPADEVSDFDPWRAGLESGKVEVVPITEDDE